MKTDSLALAIFGNIVGEYGYKDEDGITHIFLGREKKMGQIKSHNFAIDGGEYIENGKPCWPDCLTISLSRHRVLAIIEELARILQYPDQEMTSLGLKLEKINLNFIGKLDYDIDEDAEDAQGTDKG